MHILNSLIKHNGHEFDLPVALISLDDQIQRRRLLVERGVPQELVNDYFSGSDLRNADASTLEGVGDPNTMQMRYSRVLLPAEIGCAKSHQNAALWLANSRYDLMLVLEDDVIPSVCDPFAEVVRLAFELCAHARHHAFICHLGPPPEQVETALRRRVTGGEIDSSLEPRLFLHCDPQKGLWRAHAYLISRAAAQRCSSMEPRIRTLADDWCLRREMGLVDEIFFCDPRVFRQDEQIASTIRSEASKHPNEMTGRLRSDMQTASNTLIARSLPKRVISSLRYRSKIFKASILSKKPYRLA